MWSDIDVQMMAQAIALARQGRFTTAPNPNVGCVIVNQGKVVGQGFHRKAGEPHAEIHALKQAKDHAKGSTVYVTLEPCSHYGRTPPCAAALIKAGVSKVFVAMEDPNPQVSGNGITMLENAGIAVDVGLLKSASRALNAAFLSKMEQDKPLVTLKLAASLDGKTALSNGKSKWITGSEARADVQRLRASHSALVTGINTILADNPTLNVRYNQLGHVIETRAITEDLLQQPLRVVLDSTAKLTAADASNLFAFVSPILLVSTTQYSAAQLAAFPPHVDTLILPQVNGRVDLSKLLIELGKKVNSILVEAGATLAGAFIEAKLVDYLVLYQAPKILGNHGHDLLQLPNYTSMEQIPNLSLCDERKIGNDRRYNFAFTSKQLN